MKKSRRSGISKSGTSKHQGKRSAGPTLSPAQIEAQIREQEEQEVRTAQQKQEQLAEEWLSQQLLKWFLLEMFEPMREHIAYGHSGTLEIFIWELRDVIERYGMAAFLETFLFSFQQNVNAELVRAILQVAKSKHSNYHSFSCSCKYEAWILLEAKCNYLLEQMERSAKTSQPPHQTAIPAHVNRKQEAQDSPESVIANRQRQMSLMKMPSEVK